MTKAEFTPVANAPESNIDAALARIRELEARLAAETRRADETERELCGEQTKHTREILLHGVTKARAEKAEVEAERAGRDFEVARDAFDREQARAEAYRAALKAIAEWDCLAYQAKTGMTLMTQVGLIQAGAQAALAEQPAAPDEWKFCERDDKCYLHAGHSGECAKTKERRKSYRE